LSRRVPIRGVGCPIYGDRMYRIIFCNQLQNSPTLYIYHMMCTRYLLHIIIISE
jgi:hypothetical protein